MSLFLDRQRRALRTDCTSCLLALTTLILVVRFLDLSSAPALIGDTVSDGLALLIGAALLACVALWWVTSHADEVFQKDELDAVLVPLRSSFNFFSRLQINQGTIP